MTAFIASVQRWPASLYLDSVSGVGWLSKDKTSCSLSSAMTSTSILTNFLLDSKKLLKIRKNKIFKFHDESAPICEKIGLSIKPSMRTSFPARKGVIRIGNKGVTPRPSSIYNS
jgi:hypothetical protein